MALFDKVKSLFDQAKDKAAPLAEQAKDKAGPLAKEALQKAQEVSGQVREKAGPLAAEAKDKASELAGRAAPAVASRVDRAAESLDKATGGRFTEKIDTVQDKVHEAAAKAATPDTAMAPGTPAATTTDTTAVKVPEGAATVTEPVVTAPVVTEPVVDLPGPAGTTTENNSDATGTAEDRLT
jgi:gas vesicle protein